MPLYVVSVEFEMVVEADDSRKAELVAGRHADECVRDGAMYWPSEIKKVGDIPTDWRESPPWGGNGEKSCLEILEAAEEAERIPQVTLIQGGWHQVRVPKEPK